MAALGESGQRFDFTTNVYKSWGWALISVLGQKLPTTRFLPHDYRMEADALTARAASDIVPILERNNRVNLLHLRACYLLYVHGICGSYTRYVADGERFGWRDEEQVQTLKVKIQDEGFECPACFRFFGIDQLPTASAVHPPEEAAPQVGGEATPPTSVGAVLPTNAQMPMCPNCLSSLLRPVPAESVDAPVVQGVQRTPRGREIISIHSGLELRLPPWAIELQDCTYLGMVNEVHKASIRKTYGERGRQVSGGYGSGPYDTWDRFARLALIEPTVSYYSTSNENLVTLKRYWLRKEAFEMVDKEEDRDKLNAIFPSGAVIVFAEPGKLLDARNESMDDHWELAKGHEGPGMYVPSLGNSGISIQKRINVLHNFIMEWVEYAAAGQGTFVNTGLVNIKALSGQRKAPGYMYPVRLPGNIPISNALYTDRPAQIAGEIFRYSEMLEGLGRDVTAAVPTVSGGTEMSLKPTTYLADREQALGKLFIPWSHLRTFWAGTMCKGVKEFARNRSEDEFYSVWGLRGDWEGRSIYLIDLQGEFDAYPEANENFPALWHQMQAMFMKLMESQDTYIQEILGHPDNASFGLAMFGLPSLYIPGQDDRMKQRQEIAGLLQSQPIVQQVPELGEVHTLPSVSIDRFEDNHQVHIVTVKEWCVSPAGQKAKKENPAGYQNVVAHGLMHQEFLMHLESAMMGQQASGGQKGKRGQPPQETPPQGAAAGGPTGAEEGVRAAIEGGGEAPGAGGEAAQG